MNIIRNTKYENVLPATRQEINWHLESFSLFRFSADATADKALWSMSDRSSFAGRAIFINFVLMNLWNFTAKRHRSTVKSSCSSLVAYTPCGTDIQRTLVLCFLLFINQIFIALYIYTLYNQQVMSDQLGQRSHRTSSKKQMTSGCQRKTFPREKLCGSGGNSGKKNNT